MSFIKVKESLKNIFFYQNLHKYKNFDVPEIVQLCTDLNNETFRYNFGQRTVQKRGENC